MSRFLVGLTLLVGSLVALGASGCGGSGAASHRPDRGISPDDGNGTRDAAAPVDLAAVEPDRFAAIDEGGGSDRPGASGDAGPAACPSGVICVTQFPFHDEKDTSVLPAGRLDGYSCSAATDESGPEVIYQVTVPEDGFLSA